MVTMEHSMTPYPSESQTATDNGWLFNYSSVFFLLITNQNSKQRNYPRPGSAGGGAGYVGDSYNERGAGPVCSVVSTT